MQFACLRYWTRNLGDEIQTLAAMNFLPAVDQVFERDDAAVEELAEPCFLICNGWWMHRRGGQYQFPLAPNITPLFTSVRLRPEFRNAMSDAMIAYLRHHAPIGCREPDSLEFFQRHDIPAYFSGCLTSTLGLFADEPSPRDGGVCLVDVPSWAEKMIPDELRRAAVRLTHEHTRSPTPDKNTMRDHVQRLFHARRLLDQYRKASLVITGRLHCALPCLSFRTPVVFVPKNADDARYGAIDGRIPIYRREDEIDWSPTAVDVDERAVALKNLVTNAVGACGNPMKPGMSFPDDFRTPAFHVSAARDARNHLVVQDATRDCVTADGDQPDGRRPTVMFLHRHLTFARSGIENAGLLRAKLFESNLGIVPRFLTVDYDPHFSETRAELLRSGQITETLIFQNLYSFFQERHSIVDEVSAPDFPIQPNWRCVPVPDSRDTEIFDERGRLLMYKKCSPRTGSLEYVNVFHEGKKWRRDTYAAGGNLSRIQYRDMDSGDFLYEHYLRPDGSVAIIQLYTTAAGRAELSRISLMNRQGYCVGDFKSRAELITHWLDCLTADSQQDYVLVPDRNAVYYEPVQRLKQLPGKERVFVVPVIHSVHTKNDPDVRIAPVKSTYAGILADINAPAAIVVGTGKQKQDILDRFGSGNLVAIPHTFANNLPAAQPPFENRERTRIIMLGRYSAEKNQSAAIRAFAHVVRELPEATLELFGSGSEKRSLQDQARRLGLEASVRVNDYADNVSGLYATAGMTLSTSVEEGYPLVVMESLCHGCPVVAFDVNYGPSDMIEDGQTGFLVPFGNVDSLAQRILQILRDPALHERMCENAWQSARQFGAAVVGERWQRLMHTIRARVDDATTLRQ